MESTLQIMPVQRTSRNFGEYAEEERPRPHHGAVREHERKILFWIFVIGWAFRALDFSDGF